ncbi:baseplate J-like family protein [Asticcacaulis biprosthecium C19]|uniref:Baseplate J-like family protein n=1 Tax=Asticcacaulis biprosthecium C19 TaxID=715226 RepID=F4QJC2_9CAUL|nr:baseplate J/gp47 family protein [Asticcacaulis biprosthecium]EGF93105.1 baseplate J-like family protein [Asticcacaulis biprosthecium C19]
MSTSNAIDLSQLPAPNVIAALDYETILAEMVDLMQTGVAGVFEGIPDFDVTNEADPAVKVLQVAAWCRMLDRAKANDDAKACLVAYATGADLDNLAALFQVERLVGETDAAFRRRIVLAPDGYSVAGPESAYIFHALSAHPDVLDATATSPAPGQVLVTILSRVGNGTASEQLLEIISAALSSATVRPLTDQVTVQSATIVNYAVTATVYTYDGPDSSVVLANAASRAEAYRQSLRRLGRDVTRAGFYQALFADGAQNVLLPSPAADIVMDDTQAGHCTAITITHGGVAE